jgi:hypothetical protein
MTEKRADIPELVIAANDKCVPRSPERSIEKLTFGYLTFVLKRWVSMTWMEIRQLTSAHL